MIKSLEIGRSGMLSHAQSLERISHNLANMETTAYKGQETAFRGLLKNAMKSDSVALSPDMSDQEAQAGAGVRSMRDWTDFSQGTLRSTDGRLDVAIEGPGFFRVQDPDGQVFLTRKGSFIQDAAGRLVDEKGLAVDIDWEDGVRDEEKADRSIRLNNGGSLTIEDPETGQPKTLGRLSLYGLTNPNVLRGQAGSYRLDNEDLASMIDVQEKGSQSQIWGQMLESSNVDMARTMTDMIMAQRAYQLSAKSVSTADEAMQVYNRLLG